MSSGSVESVRVGRLLSRLRRAHALIALQTVLCVRFAAADANVEDWIDLVVDGSNEDAQALAGALREPLQRLGLTAYPSGMVLSDDAGAHAGTRSRARVWISTRGADSIEIVVAVGPTDTIPTRRSLKRTVPWPVVVDQVAYVVRATLESLLSTPRGLAAGAPGLLPAGSEPLAPVPSTAPTPGEPDSATTNAPPQRSAADGPALGLDIAAFATGKGIAKGAAAVLGSGGSLELSFWGRQLFRPRLSVGASFNGPFESSGPVASLRASVWSVRVVSSMALLRWRWLGLDAGVGGGADGFNASSTASAGAPFPVAPLDVATIVDPVLSGQVVLGLSPTGSASVLLGGYVDYDAAPHRYVTVDGSGQVSPVLEPWRLRPAVMAGLCIPLAGAGACGRHDHRAP